MKPATAGQELQARATIRTGAQSMARIRVAESEIFTLPAEAQIEIRELRKLTRDEVVMELTALELQRLPEEKSAPLKSPNAFILHGEQPKGASLPEASTYLRHEERGVPICSKFQFRNSAPPNLFFLTYMLHLQNPLPKSILTLSTSPNI